MLQNFRKFVIMSDELFLEIVNIYKKYFFVALLMLF